MVGLGRQEGGEKSPDRLSGQYALSTELTDSCAVATTSRS